LICLIQKPDEILANHRLPEFEGDRVARQQSVEKCLAHLLHGTRVALGCLVERLEQLLPALLMRTSTKKFASNTLTASSSAMVYWCVCRAIEFPSSRSRTISILPPRVNLKVWSAAKIVRMVGRVGPYAGSFNELGPPAVARNLKNCWRRLPVHDSLRYLPDDYLRILI
jgi:hypothetical protein